MSDVKTLRSFVFGLAVALLVVIALVVLVWTKLAGDEYASCIVQARGLKANVYLAASMGDISQLLSIQPTSKQATPPKEALVPLLDLRQNAGAYYAIQSQQPKTRQC